MLTGFGFSGHENFVEPRRQGAALDPLYKFVDVSVEAVAPSNLLYVDYDGEETVSNSVVPGASATGA